MLNVATGRYVPLQARLLRSLASVGWKGAVLTWTDAFPPGSPRHEDVPYAFKLHALLEARRLGHRSALWLDAPCVAKRSLTPIFEAIEQDGHLFRTGGEKLGNWVSDACLRAFGLSRDRAMELPMLNGSFLGLDFSSPLAATWFNGLLAACERGLFQGSYLSPHAPIEVRLAKPGKPVGFVSRDARCWGHRHDEAVGSCLAAARGMRILPLGKLFDTRETGTAVVRIEAP